MWRDFGELARGVAQLLIPNACLICDRAEEDRTDFRHGLCKKCYLAVTSDPHSTCSRCAATVGPHTDTSDGCPSCRGQRFGFGSAWRLGPYWGALREATLRMKSHSGEALAEMLGRSFAEVFCPQLRGAGIDMVVPVPLHWRRHWVRGYNQAAALAREVAAGLEVECDSRALQRVRYTPQQVQPSASARRENVKGAFRARRGARLASRTILLMDDVMTTGSTLAETARILLQAGAKQVVAAVLARRC